MFFETSLNGAEWYELPVLPIEGGNAVTMTAAAGMWLVTVSGLGLVRCRLAGTVLGAITVLGIGTVASS